MELNYDEMPESTAYYHRLKTRLLEKLNNSKCRVCGETDEQQRRNYERRLQFHHTTPNSGFETGCGGMNHLLKIKKQVQKGVEIEPVCLSCHVALHQNNDDLDPHPKDQDGMGYGENLE